MKKVLFFAVSTLVVLGFMVQVGLCQGKKDKRDMEKGKMMMKAGDMMNMCQMHVEMMKTITQKTIIATSDGGVVVMMGDKLMKYDKSLKLVGETEIKMNVEVIMKVIESTKECPMCNKMKKRMPMPDEAPKEPPRDIKSETKEPPRDIESEIEE